MKTPRNSLSIAYKYKQFLNYSLFIIHYSFNIIPFRYEPTG